MSRQTIELYVLADGAIVIDAVGCKGPDCEQATRILEQALGEKTYSTKKPEHDQRRTVRNPQRLGRG